MKCNPELLSEYYDDELSTERRREVEAHLRECAACAGTLAEYRQMSAAIKGLPRELAPAKLEGDLADRLARSRARGWWRRLLAPAVELGAIAVTAVVVILAVGGALRGVDFSGRPIVTASTPGTNNANVPTNTAIRVSFDRSMDRASVEAALLVTPSLKAEYLWRGDDLYVVPKEPLKPDTKYTVAVDDSARDGEGRPMEKPYSVEFATSNVVATEPPTIPDVPQPTPRPALANIVKPPTPVAAPSANGTPAPASTLAMGGTPTPATPPAPAALASPGAMDASPGPGETPSSQPKASPAAPSAAAPSVTTGRPVPLLTPGVGVTATVAPAPTPTLPITETSVITVTRGFGQLYEQDIEVQQRLGTPVNNERGVLAAEQPFERGYMLWRMDTSRVYVLSADGTWRAFDDTWTEGEPDTSPPAPEGMYAPTRGFGKVWAENPDVQTALGWALKEEHGFIGAVQDFDNGSMLWTDQPMIYVLYTDGTWESHADSFQN